MASEPMKIGILGTGMIATSRLGYLPGMKHLEAKFIPWAVCDPAVERARKIADEYGIPEVYSDLDEMLERSPIDVILNLTPIPLHGPLTLRALEAGRHVVSEKPLATSMADADAIIGTARTAGLTVVCAPPNMLYPNRIEAKRLIAEGAIGKVCFARVRSSHGGPASGNWPMDPTWFYQEGSGPLFDMGVYGLHDITGILGPAKRVSGFSGITEPVRVVRGGPFAGKKIEVTADDNTVMMLDFGESTFAFVDATFNVNDAKSPQIEIFGRTGTLNVPTAREQMQGAPQLDLYDIGPAPGQGKWSPVESPALASAYERVTLVQRALVVEHLVDCVREGRQPVLSAEHARHVLEIMVKAIESARSGRVLELTTTF